MTRVCVCSEDHVVCAYLTAVRGDGPSLPGKVWVWGFLGGDG